MDLAWWALAVIEVLGFVWLIVLAAGYVRLRRLLRQLHPDRRPGDSDHHSNHTPP